jgi:hypothetical protein
MVETNWADTVLDASNDLTEFLHAKYPTEYSRWNEIARKAREEVERGLAPLVQVAAAEASLGSDFVDSAKWVILSALVESAYTSCRPPVFFLRLLPVYEAGHAVCGWQGERPKGKLLVY